MIRNSPFALLAVCITQTDIPQWAWHRAWLISAVLIHTVGRHFSEAQQLAHTLTVLAKNTKQDASLSTILTMQIHSQPIGALVSPSRAVKIKLHMSGCMPPCVVVVVFICLHVFLYVSLLPACFCIYVKHAQSTDLGKFSWFSLCSTTLQYAILSLKTTMKSVYGVP